MELETKIKIIEVCLYAFFLIVSIVASTLALIGQAKKNKNMLPNILEQKAKDYKCEVQRQTISLMRKQGVQVPDEIVNKALDGIDVMEELNKMKVELNTSKPKIDVNAPKQVEKK